LHVGTQGFSPRARNDVQMIRFGANAGRVGVRGERAGTAFEVDLVLNPRDSRRVRLNGSQLSSAEQLRHELQALVFTPDRLAVVKGGPATRRAYLDRSLARLAPSKAQLPLEYATAVGQRNAALRRVAAGFSSNDALGPWTETVATLGAQLVEARRSAVSALASAFAACAGKLGLDDAVLSYEGDPPTTEELEARLDRDLERGTTGIGPHLHDVRLDAGGRELRSFGSQGEQRVAVLALVLAESATLSERAGASPLVLLDDVLSELDGDRRRALASLIETGGQTVLTTTSADAFPAVPAQSLRVSSGAVHAA
jgi:DNA replication and repair protein RecF